MSEQIVDRAKDLNGAVAGQAEPTPELNTVDAVAKRAGVELSPEESVNVVETLKERDRNRLEKPE